MIVRDFAFSFQQWLSGGDSGPIIVAVIGAVILLFVLITLGLALYSRTPQGRVDALLEERAEGGDWSRWITRLVVLALVVAGLYAFETQADNPQQCARCHSQVAWADTLAQTAHADQDCMSCHGATGVAAVPANMATYVRWVFVYTSEKAEPEPRTGSVDSGTCLSCHESIARRTVESRGIRVRHADFLDAGSVCRDCHNAIAHGEAVRQPTTPQMSDCIVCHDGERASQECAYCHAVDPMELAALDQNMPKVNDIDSDNCYGCHDETPCIRCHGVRMPHPEGWSDEAGRMGESGEFHAREGFAKREICWRCHYSNDRPFERPTTLGGFRETQDGCTCHGSFGTMHGGAAWVQEHGLQATGVKTGQYAYCYDCHDARYFCDMCHEPTMKERYNPRGGPDAYSRDVPHPPDYWEY